MGEAEDSVSAAERNLEPSLEQIEEWRRTLSEIGSARALARFENYLNYAGGLRQRGEEKIGVLMTVNATLKLILGIPRLKCTGAQDDISKLIAAFHDVAEGVRPRLFTPDSPAHRPLDSTEARGLRGAAAGAMEILMRCLKYRKQEAARLVADELQRIGISIGAARSEALPANTIASWRDHAKSGNQREDYDAYIYAVCVAKFEPLAAAEMKQNSRIAVTRKILSILSDNRPNPPC